MAHTVYTVGHSTRSLDDLCALLAGVKVLFDVRRIARSRHNPQFNDANLRAALPEHGIDYFHVPDLGGKRAATPDRPSVNDGWPQEAFRAYADYALTRPFAAAFDDLERCARAAPSAVMCAEKDWRRCHRQIIADYLMVRDRAVIHLIAPDESEPARLTPLAEVQGDGTVLYPKPPPRQGELVF